MTDPQSPVTENRSRPAALDPRDPLVLDTRELARRPGSQRTVRLTAPAPADLGTVMIGVPAGSPLDIQVRLESVLEGVLVTGRVEVPLVGECGRCLDPVASHMEVDWQELYAYPESEATEDEVSRMSGDHLDLESSLRDAVVLALPLTPLCRDDCPGLCVVCGEHLADGDCGHSGTPTDPRWVGLVNWQDDSAPETGTPDEE